LFPDADVAQSDVGGRGKADEDEEEESEDMSADTDNMLDQVRRHWDDSRITPGLAMEN
jgi:hypothetical protein